MTNIIFFLYIVRKIQFCRLVSGRRNAIALGSQVREIASPGYLDFGVAKLKLINNPSRDAMTQESRARS